MVALGFAVMVLGLTIMMVQISDSMIMPLLVGPVVLCLPVVSSILLPRYMAGMQAAQILAVGAFFFAHVVVLRGIIAARKRQRDAIKRVVIALHLRQFACCKPGLGNCRCGTVIIDRVFYRLFIVAGIVGARFGTESTCLLVPIPMAPVDTISGHRFTAAGNESCINCFRMQWSTRCSD